MARYSVNTEAMMRSRTYSVEVTMNNKSPSQHYDSSYQFTKQTGWHIQNIRSNTVHPRMQIGDTEEVEVRHKENLYRFAFTRTN